MLRLDEPHSESYKGADREDIRMGDETKKYILSCPHCKGKMYVRADMAGREIICAECAEKIKVPAQIGDGLPPQQAVRPKPKTAPPKDLNNMVNRLPPQIAKRTKDVARGPVKKKSRPAPPPEPKKSKLDFVRDDKESPQKTPFRKTGEKKAKRKFRSVVCPHCDSVIPERADVCPFCEKIVRKKGPAVCPHCDSVIPKRAIICPFCEERVHAPPAKSFVEKMKKTLKPSNLFSAYSVTGFAAVFHFLLIGYVVIAAALFLWLSNFFLTLKFFAQGHFQKSFKHIGMWTFACFVLWVIGRYLKNTGSELRVWNAGARIPAIFTEIVFAIAGLFLGGYYMRIAAKPGRVAPFMQTLLKRKIPVLTSWNLQVIVFFLLGITAIVAILGLTVIDAKEFPKARPKRRSLTGHIPKHLLEEHEEDDKPPKKDPEDEEGIGEDIYDFEDDDY